MFFLSVINIVPVCIAISFAGENTQRPPKNIIIMIADGCGYNHLEAAGCYQYAGTDPEPCRKFPVRCAMSTYSLRGSYDPQQAWADFKYVTRGYTDSAAAATAMATGVKTFNGYIGIDRDGKTLKNLIERCEELGKATGVITSVPWTHATPAAFVAHSKSRNNYGEISHEMVFASALEVIMGTGHPYYDNDGKPRKRPGYKYISSNTWKALVEGTASSDADGDGIKDTWTLVQTRRQFQTLMTGPAPKRVCGTATALETLQQKRSGKTDAAPFQVDFIETVPTLDEMARAAINVLDDDPDGFFLMIEGGAVDWASHANQSGRMIEEMVAFDKTIEAVITWIEKNSSWDQTLLIVTGDHETGYITGPDSGQKAGRPLWKPLENKGKGQVPGFEWHSSSHTNSLIPFLAAGCSSSLYETAATHSDPVRGKYIDNTDVARVIFALLEQPLQEGHENRLKVPQVVR